MHLMYRISLAGRLRRDKTASQIGQAIKVLFQRILINFVYVSREILGRWALAMIVGKSYVLSLSFLTIKRLTSQLAPAKV